MNKLAIVGMGLVSPLGLTPEEHAFYLRAEVFAAAPGGFVDEEGEPVRAAYCPWLGAETKVEDRLSSLAVAALRTACDPLRDSVLVSASGRLRAGLHVITAAPRAGLVDADRRAVETAVGGGFESGRAARATGQAAVFSTLATLGERLSSGEAAVIVAVDSMISLPALAEHQRAYRSSWAADLPRAGEVAACVAVMAPEMARRERIPVLATIHDAAVLRGEANDDNDVPNDGSALTSLVRAAAAPGGLLRASFGPHGAGSLRRREWEMTAARVPERVDLQCEPVCLESHVGLAGAASGLSALVFGAAVHRHGTWASPRASDGAFLAWSISPDGTRGIAVATAGGG